MWTWTKKRPNYFVVSDETGLNMASFRRANSKSPWIKYTIIGKVPFNIDSEELEKVSQAKKGRPHQFEKPLLKTFSIRVSDEQYEKLKRMDKNVIYDFIDSYKL